MNTESLNLLGVLLIKETADSICCQVTLLVYVQLFAPPRLPGLCSAMLLPSQLVPVHILGKSKVYSSIDQTIGGHPVKLILKSRGNLKLWWSGIHHLNLKLTNYIHKAIQSVLNSISKEFFTTLQLLFLFSKHIMTNKSWYYKKIKRQQLQNIMEPLKNNCFIMARTGKVKDFSETRIRVSNQTQFCCTWKQMQI